MSAVSGKSHVARGAASVGVVTRRALLAIACTAGLTGGAVAQGLGLQGEAQRTDPPFRPNVLFVLLDDWGWADLGSVGGAIETPNLDAFAQEGVRLTRFVTNASVCSPSRVALLGGIPPASIGALHAYKVTSRRGLPDDVVSVAEFLAGAGYRTAHVGKWHVGEDFGPDTQEFLPAAAGFDRSVRLLRKANETHWDPQLVIDEARTVQTLGHGTDVLTGYALDALDDLAAGPDPFLLNLWYFAPHLPAQSPQPWIDVYTGGGPATSWDVYRAMVTQLDASIGLVLDRLELLGLADETLVIVTSDNGGSGQEGLHPDGNGPWRGFKGEPFEGGLRVPFLARWPGRIVPGTTNDSLTLTYDWLPTVADLVGLAPPPGLPGRSLLDALLGADVGRGETLFWEEKGQAFAYDPVTGMPDEFAVRRDDGVSDWKLVFDKDEVVWLSELVSDPGEVVNRVATDTAVAQELWDAYWDQRLPGALVPWSAVASGGVLVDGDSFTFADGLVEIPADARVDSHDGDFTLTFTLTVDGFGRQQIVRKSGSWEMEIDASGFLEVTVTGAAGELRTLTSRDPLDVGKPYDIAFRVTSWPAGKLSLDLFVDGVENDDAKILAIAPNRNPIELGKDGPAGVVPFFGTIDALRFYTLPATRAELLGGWPALPIP